MAFNTCDLSDANSEHTRAITGSWIHYGARRNFSGPVQTLHCPGDNSLVRQTLPEDGKGAVLVVDAGANNRCAMLGDRLANLGASNGWSGLVIYGMVRDVEQLREVDLGIAALGSVPVKSEQLGRGQKDLDICIGGVTVSPGQWIYVDETGVLLAENPLLDEKLS